MLQYFVAELFNLFLVAITLAFRHGVTMEEAVEINYRLDGNLFNVRRLQAKTKTNSEHVFELQYAALPSHSAEGLQRNLDNISANVQKRGSPRQRKENRSDDPASAAWSSLRTSCLFD